MSYAFRRYLFWSNCRWNPELKMFFSATIYQANKKHLYLMQDAKQIPQFIFKQKINAHNTPPLLEQITKIIFIMNN